MAPMLNKDIAIIDWKNKTAKEIKDLVRGLNPFMGAYSFLNDKKIKFWKVEIVDEKPCQEPGTVILASHKEGLFISTVDKVISVLEVQGENARRMSISDYLRGNSIEIGEKFK